MKSPLARSKWLRYVALCIVGAMLLAAVMAESTKGATEVVHVDFDNDIPGQPPLTGGLGQPTSLVSNYGTSILVQGSANGIATQPVVLTAQEASQFAAVFMWLNPISENVVRIEATVALDRLAWGFFLQTSACSGAVVTRLDTTDFGEIQNDATRIPVGIYAPNQPFRIRMDIDMSADNWSVAVDNEMNGFDDDPVVSNLPFENPVNVLPTLCGVWASIALFPVLSVAPTVIAYDDVRVLAGTVLTVSKNGGGSGTVVSSPAGINCGSVCSELFTINSAILLSATPDVGGSLFIGWGGDADCADGVMTMAGAKSCTATFNFCEGPPARIGASLYDTIGEAYAGASLISPDTIEVVASNQQETLTFSQGKNFTLKGGHDCQFAPLTLSYTTITGSLTINSGAVTIDRIAIR